MALDTKAGRDLVQKTFVDDRTRSFAAYALGLIAWNTKSQDVKMQVLGDQMPPDLKGTHFVQKPFTASELAEQVSCALRRPRLRVVGE